MACLYSKHFGDKISFCDLKKSVVDEMLKVSDTISKTPNHGILGRFDDGAVGLFVWCVGEYGRLILIKEPTTHKTIFSWAKFHTHD